MFLDTLMNMKKYGKLFSLSINENEYYEFTSSEDANRWGHLLYDDWANEYVKLEGTNDFHNTPIFIYTGTAYCAIKMNILRTSMGFSVHYLKRLF